jgi:serine/threonine protein kinase
MGEVYLAVLEREGGFSKTVALKTVLPIAGSRKEFTELFESEATVAAMLNHVNIVQVFDHGSFESKSFLTMELVEGPDLASLVEATGRKPLPPEVASEIGVQALRGLGHAHDRRDLRGLPVGIVHCDVSPSNILISLEGQVKLADFGLAKLRSAVPEKGLLTGKYSYMSPEQASGLELTPRSDLFSLGLVLYELFTGNKAYRLRDPPSDTLEAIRRGGHKPAVQALPRLAGDVAALLDRALSLRPEDRFPSAHEMSRALSRACPPCGPENLSAFVRPHTPRAIPQAGLAPEPTEVASKPVSPTALSRPVWKAPLMTLVLLAWGAGFGWWAFHRTPPPRPSPPASSLPEAPGGLRARVAHLPVVEPSTPANPVIRKTPGSKPDPTRVKPFLYAKVEVTIQDGYRAVLDHRPVQGGTIRILERHAHLIRVFPDKGGHPELVLRLNPPEGSSERWRMSIATRPWMQIRLGKLPLGQTPKTDLPLPQGHSRLVLRRDDTVVRLSLSVRGNE